MSRLTCATFAPVCATVDARTAVDDDGQLTEPVVSLADSLDLVLGHLLGAFANVAKCRRAAGATIGDVREVARHHLASADFEREFQHADAGSRAAVPDRISEHGFAHAWPAGADDQACPARGR